MSRNIYCALIFTCSWLPVILMKSHDAAPDDLFRNPIEMLNSSKKIDQLTSDATATLSIQQTNLSTTISSTAAKIDPNQELSQSSWDPSTNSSSSSDAPSSSTIHLTSNASSFPSTDAETSTLNESKTEPTKSKLNDDHPAAATTTKSMLVIVSSSSADIESPWSNLTNDSVWNVSADEQTGNSLDHLSLMLRDGEHGESERFYHAIWWSWWILVALLFFLILLAVLLFGLRRNQSEQHGSDSSKISVEDPTISGHFQSHIPGPLMPTYSPQLLAGEVGVLAGGAHITSCIFPHLRQYKKACDDETSAESPVSQRVNSTAVAVHQMIKSKEYSTQGPTGLVALSKRGKAFKVTVGSLSGTPTGTSSSASSSLVKEEEFQVARSTSHATGVRSKRAVFVN